MVLSRKYSQQYTVNAKVPEDFILAPTLFLLYINDLLDYITCNIAADTTLYSMCDQISDMCQQLELAQQQLGCFGRWFTDFGDI